MNVPFRKMKPGGSVWFDQKVFTAELIDNCPNSYVLIKSLKLFQR